MKELTDKERKAISRLQVLVEIWPKSLWLFSANGVLYLMKTDDNGERARLPTGQYSQDYIICSIGIESDGGDW